MIRLVRGVVMLALSVAVASPAGAQSAANDGRFAGWRTDTAAASSPDPARLSERAYVSGLNHMSHGLDARDAGNLDEACKHFRKAETLFRRAGDVQSKSWSARLAEETCPKD